MKIGDKVRFLSEVGGGKVSGFQGKDIVLVEDEDGFEIPMLASQVVVIDTDDYNIAKVNTMGRKPADEEEKARPITSVKQALKVQDEDLEEEEEVDIADLPRTFHAKPVERKDGNLINLYLAFVPNEVKEMGQDATFETYLVNDSNYYLNVLYMSVDGANWRSRFQAIVEPNTKLFVEDFDRSQLGDLERVCIQCMAFKQEKTFQLKPAYNVELRIDQVKFYKLHVFQQTPFFRDPALVYDVVRDDKPARQVFVNAEELQEALLGRKAPSQQSSADKRKAQPARQPQADGPIEVDLHIDKLLDDTHGLNNADMLRTQMEEFKRVMEENKAHRGRKIVFIHGKGDGVLRQNIIQELRYRYKQCTWQDASFREYGYGATMVKIG